MSGMVYILCAATSFLCAAMLFRGYRQTGVRLLFWSSICFLGLTIDNVLLYADLVVIPDTSLTLFRRLAALAALLFLVFGLVWDAK